MILSLLIDKPYHSLISLKRDREEAARADNKDSIIGLKGAKISDLYQSVTEQDGYENPKLLSAANRDQPESVY